MLSAHPIRRRIASLGLVLLLLAAQLSFGLCTARCTAAAQASLNIAANHACCPPAGHTPMAPAQNCHQPRGVAVALPATADHAALPALSAIAAAAGPQWLWLSRSTFRAAPRTDQPRPPTLPATPPLRI